jgi:hypothetical protein
VPTALRCRLLRDGSRGSFCREIVLLWCYLLVKSVCGWHFPKTLVELL